METRVKISLGGDTVVTTTGNGTIEELTGQASAQLAAKASLTLVLEIESPDLKKIQTCKIRIPASLIMAKVKGQVEKAIQAAAREKDMKQFAEAQAVFESILATMQKKYPDFSVGKSDKVPAVPKAALALPGLVRKKAAKPKSVAPPRDQSPPRSSSEKDDDYLPTKPGWDEPGTLAKFSKEWQELWPAFKAFALNRDIQWEKDLPVYQRVWRENEFFLKALQIMLPHWTGPKTGTFTEASLMDWIDRQHQIHEWHAMSRTDAAFVGKCAGCDETAGLNWKFLIDRKDEIGAVWYGDCCGVSLALVYDFLSSTHTMLKEKRRTKGNLGGALRWWCLLVNCLDDMADLVKK